MTTSVQFPYRDRNPAQTGVDLMPDLPITLRSQTQTINAIGLVDSGAMVSVLPYSLGLQLGLDWNAQKTPISLGGTFAGTSAKGVVLETIVGKLPPVRLVFAWAQSDRVPLLLGEFNFFEVFDVVFMRSRRIFEIRTMTSSPSTV